MPQVKIDNERFDDLLGDEFFGFFEGNPIWLFRALAHFVLDDQGEYMEQEEGFRWLKANMTVKAVREMRGAIIKQLQESAVPFKNEKHSETPPSPVQESPPGG